MDKITIFIDKISNQEYVIIDRGNGEFTSMLKSTYEELQKQADQPIGGNK
jgi:Uma2 family endonuclease